MPSAKYGAGYPTGLEMHESTLRNETPHEFQESAQLQLTPAVGTPPCYTLNLICVRVARARPFLIPQCQA